MSAQDSITNALIISLSVIALVGTGIVVDRKLLPPASSSRSTEQLDSPRTIPNWETVISSGHRLGPAQAPVTLLEFGDFQCPACRLFALSSLQGIRVRYPDSVAIVFRHWPLPYHEFAYSAARAAECAANQGRFAAFHDALYRHQDSLGVVKYETLAKESGVSNLSTFAACIQDSTPVAAIETDILAARQLGAHATPTLAVDGQLFPRVPDSSALDAFVRERLKQAANR